MSQTNLDDDELFGEAANEMRSDVEASLAEARGALPEADAVWDVEADNTLGVLNALKTALDVGDAEDHLRDAKKWYTMGERADAFEDADDLAEEIETVADLVDDVEEAREQVGDLTATIPQLRSTLEEFEDEGADAEADAESVAGGSNEMVTVASGLLSASVAARYSVDDGWGTGPNGRISESSPNVIGTSSANPASGATRSLAAG